MLLLIARNEFTLLNEDREDILVKMFQVDVVQIIAAFLFDGPPVYLLLKLSIGSSSSSLVAL